jgi:hypothetical protein
MNDKKEKLMIESIIITLDTFKDLDLKDLKASEMFGKMKDAMEKIEDKFAESKKNNTAERQPIQYIIAGDYSQYQEYLSTRKLRQSDAKYMSLYHNWACERPDKLILVGDWWNAEVWNIPDMRKTIVDLIIKGGYNPA